jgi:hypothetical protein
VLLATAATAGLAPASTKYDTIEWLPLLALYMRGVRLVHRGALAAGGLLAEASGWAAAKLVGQGPEMSAPPLARIFTISRFPDCSQPRDVYIAPGSAANSKSWA